MSFTQLENHSQLLCGRDFANERLSDAQPAVPISVIRELTILRRRRQQQRRKTMISLVKRA